MGLITYLALLRDALGNLKELACQQNDSIVLRLYLFCSATFLWILQLP